METIPEDINDEFLHSSQHQLDTACVLREIYRSEKLERHERRVAAENLPSLDPRMYRPEDLGPPDNSSTSYQYSYERTFDGPPMPEPPEIISERLGNAANVERQRVQSQRVTRVTKTTTTRTVEHIPTQFGSPLDGSPSKDSERYADYVNVGGPDDSYPPYIVSEIETPSVSEKQYRNSDFSPYAVPSAPGAPQVIHVDKSMITLVWLQPDREGDAGPVLGYVVEFRRLGDGANWYPTHTGLVQDTQFTVLDLEPEVEYEFRVVAHNSAGFGQPSNPSAIVQLRPMLTGTDPNAIRRPRDPHDRGVPYPPGRPQVVGMDGTTATLTWEPPIDTGSGGPLIGYSVEYRPPGTDWITANNYPIRDNSYTVTGLRPNGDYEFQVLAKNPDGFSEPSQSTGPVRIKPMAPPRSPIVKTAGPPVPGRPSKGGVPAPPSQPQVADVDSTSVTLLWAPPPGKPVIGYRIECRPIGEQKWFAATDDLITDNQFLVDNLPPNSTFEFRIYAKNYEGWSEPSEVSEIVQLRPKLIPPPHSQSRSVPLQPEPPQILEVVDDTVTLCWAPAQSNSPIVGYQLELRDLTSDPQWNTVNSIPTQDCKLAVSNLLPRHEYQFRVVAKNNVGYSEPSAPSQPVVISLQNGFPPGYASESAPLPEEIRAAHESPPITDTEDSPPPLRRNPPVQNGGDGVQWRDPTLPEVIEFLDHQNNLIKQNAAGYLQHLTYHDDVNKNKTRELGGIRKLIDLLRNSELPETQRNACGCLRNISFGRQNDENKRAIRDEDGIPVLVRLLKKNPDMPVKEEITGVLWNLSSCDELKPLILQQTTNALVQIVIIPYSGWPANSRANQESLKNPTVFRNATGILRNVSSQGESARKLLREENGLVEALLYFFDNTIKQGDCDNKSVENVTCILRNLSYRSQEVEDPEYDRHPPPVNGERSKSAPSGSPKIKQKENKKSKSKGKKGKSDQPDSPNENPGVSPKGMALLWQPEVVKMYLKVLQESSNPETLEAAAGAVQNLAACYWQPAIEIRATVRKEKGLPIFVELLRMEVDRLVCSVAGALRNLAMDQRNKELIGKYAIKDLIEKLPSETSPRNPSVSDDTISAVLGVLYQTILGSSEFGRNLMEGGGVDRLMFLTRTKPNSFSPRVVKYASQVLFVMWQHRDLQDSYRKAGWRESDFVGRSLAAGRSPAGTLARPVSTQGGNTPSRNRPDIYEEFRNPPSQRQNNGIADGESPDSVHLRHQTNGHNNDYSRQTRVSGEPMYAPIHKGNRDWQPSEPPSHYKTAVPAGDSWV